MIRLGSRQRVRREVRARDHVGEAAAVLRGEVVAQVRARDRARRGRARRAGRRRAPRCARTASRDRRDRRRADRGARPRRRARATVRRDRRARGCIAPAATSAAAMWRERSPGVAAVDRLCVLVEERVEVERVVLRGDPGRAPGSRCRAARCGRTPRAPCRQSPATMSRPGARPAVHRCADRRSDSRRAPPERRRARRPRRASRARPGDRARRGPRRASATAA